MPAGAIFHVTACRPAQNGAYFLKNMRIERRRSISMNSKMLECWTSTQVFQISVMCNWGQSSIMQNVPNSKRLGQLNSMRLLANMCL